MRETDSRESLLRCCLVSQMTGGPDPGCLLLLDLGVLDIGFWVLTLVCSEAEGDPASLAEIA